MGSITGICIVHAIETEISPHSSFWHILRSAKSPKASSAKEEELSSETALPRRREVRPRRTKSLGDSASPTAEVDSTTEAEDAHPSTRCHTGSTHGEESLEESYRSR